VALDPHRKSALADLRTSYGRHRVDPMPARGGERRNLLGAVVRLWTPAFRLRAPGFGGLKPAVARAASVGRVAGGRVDNAI
jgi:hypothetical protein